MDKLQKAALRKAKHERQVVRRLEKKKARLALQQQDPEEDDDIDLEAGDVIEDDEETPSEVERTEAEPVAETEPEAAVSLNPAIFHSDEPEEVPALKKDMYGPESGMVEPYQRPLGATSWDELDAEREAEDQAREVRLASYDTEDLVRNILEHPQMDAAEKSTAIQAVGSGFQDRIDTILSGPQDMKKEKDIDVLEIEAILAADNRHTSISERMGDFISKAVLTTTGRKKLSAGQFALVVHRNGQTIKKYPIHDKAHVRNALARAAQQIKRGGQGAADARAALPKIHAAAKRMGIGASKEKGPGGIIVQKDMKGDWRWVGLMSNNFADWHGDIISKAAHEDYAAWLDSNPDMAPLFRSWHTPGTERKNRPDFWTFENGFMIMSGKLEESEAAHLFKAQAKTDLGMSFEGFGVRDPNDPHVFNMYRAYEVSDLPLDAAANPFTDFSVIVKEVDMDKKEYLATILGSKEAAEAFITKTGMKQEQLEKAGVPSKAKIGAPAPAGAAPVAAAPVPGATTEPAKADPSAVLVEKVIKETGLEELSKWFQQAQEAVDKIPILEGVIKEMQASQDEKLAEKIAPRAGRFSWMQAQRASEAPDTVVKPDDEIAKRAPGLGKNWLSEATGTTPIEAEAVH